MAYTSALVLLILVGASAVLAKMALKVQDCTRDKAHELMSVENFNISPYPVAIPGNIQVSGKVHLNRDITKGPMKVSLSVKRYLGFFWMPVPCISNVGSCTYNNICGMIDAAVGQHCPAEVGRVGLKCSCEQHKGTYAVENMPFAIPQLSGTLASLAKGDYKVDARLYDGSGNELTCLHIEATVEEKHKCSGFLCNIFG